MTAPTGSCKLRGACPLETPSIEISAPSGLLTMASADIAVAASLTCIDPAPGAAAADDESSRCSTPDPRTKTNTAATTMPATTAAVPASTQPRPRRRGSAIAGLADASAADIVIVDGPGTGLTRPGDGFCIPPDLTLAT